MNRPIISPAPVRQQIRVEATPARAFEVFTARMGRWWLPSHSISASPLKDVRIEGRVGGRWFEVGEDGSESPWGKVLVWEPPGRVVLAWQVGPDWKFDPGLLTEVEIRFVAEDARHTRVELEHRNLERYGDKAEAMRDAFSSPEGWTGLLRRFGDAFAA